MGKSASHIIVLAAAGFHNFLEFRNNPIIAAMTFIVYASTIMNFLTAI